MKQAYDYLMGGEKGINLMRIYLRRATRLEAGASVFSLGPSDLSSDSGARLLIFFTVGVETGGRAGRAGRTPRGGGQCAATTTNG